MINCEDTTIQIPVAGVHPDVYSLNVLYGQSSEPKGSGEPQWGQGSAFFDMNSLQSGHGLNFEFRFFSRSARSLL